MGSAAKEFSFFDRQTKCPFLALCFYIFTLFSFASCSWRVDAFLLPSASFTAVSKATVTGGKDNAVQANTSIRGKINPLQVQENSEKSYHFATSSFLGTFNFFLIFSALYFFTPSSGNNNSLF